MRCEWCGRVEYLTPREESRVKGPFYCSDHCEDNAQAQQEAWEA